MQVLALAAAMLALAAVPSYGQQLRRYQPSSPTISPYMNLLRTNVGPLPNYYSLVRPQLNQLEFNRQQVATQAQQAASLRLLEKEGQKSQAATPTGKGSWFMTSGRAGYMNTSRFYSRAPAGAAGRRQ
jgi:hypothetical protein